MVALSFLMIAMLQCPPSAEYVAGIDAKGWAVAPADLPAKAHAFEQVTLDLELPAAGYRNHAQLQQHFPFASIDVGDAVIGQDGSVALNGQQAETQRADEPPARKDCPPAH